MTDPLGQSQVIPYLAGLKKHGYNITILSCEKEQVFIAGESRIQAMLDKEGIKWMPLRYSKTPPVLSTLWDVVKLKKAAKKIIITTEKDAVRLQKFEQELKDVPFFVLPIGVEFLFDSKPAFNELIINFIQNFSVQKNKEKTEIV